MRLSALPLLLLSLLGASPSLHDGASTPPVSSEQLGGADRFLTHVTTDKPIYRPGETFFARGVVLHAATHRPATNLSWAQVEVTGPKGDVVAQGATSGADGVIAWSWVVPEGQAGGRYVVKMTGPRQVPGERAFEVRAFRAPRIKSQVVFLRDGYGPGDEVKATLEATRAEGGAPANAKVTLVAMVDGVEVANQPAGAIDADGRLSVSFRLPKTIERGEGTLALVIEDGGVVETASKTIPILVNAVDLALYPEGGDLVAGLPTRLYVEARTPADKPADVAGVVETAAGKVVARFRTEHEGRGRVRLAPEAGQRYRIRISEPAGITKTYDLPEVKTTGGVVGTFEDLARAGAPLRVRLGASATGTYRVTASAHEAVVAERRVRLTSGSLASVALELPPETEGVLRVTLWDGAGKPLAERLVFRAPKDAVKVEITSDRPRYVPAGTVSLNVKTTRADGSPIPATVGLSVSDDSVRELLETRDQPPSLPVQVFLEDDVRELADAAVYLDPDNPKAPRAVDLLLGTQGWRRFAFVADPQSFVASLGDAGRRALAFQEPPMPATPSVAFRAEDGDLRAAAGAALGRVVGNDRLPVPAAAPMPEPVAVQAKPAELDQERRDQPVVAKENEVVAARGMKKDAFMAERQVAAKQVAEEGFFDRKREMPVFVREYAHAVRPGRRAGDRKDFTDTVYWNAGLRTDDDGEARVTFALSDAVTSFRVLCDAFTNDGVLGAGTQLVESVEPFYLEPKLPLEVTSGDVVALPITVVNGTMEDFANVVLTASASDGLTLERLDGFPVASGDRVRRMLGVRVGPRVGTAELSIAGVAGGFGDTVTRTLRVAPLGFPTSVSFGGTLAPDARLGHSLVVPDDVVPGSLRVDAKVFPTSLGKLTTALERLIQEPYGCFEQTSSTTYPLVMAQQYFVTHSGVSPALITKSQELLAKGYEKLIGFETKTKGYEWFGESPGHEALSAFGLMEFTDMARVREVDPAMLARTREWVLASRDGKGGFKRERRALHTWIEDVDCSNAYIVWTLLETGEPASRLTPEIDALAKAARASKNSYVHALAANVMQLAGRKSDADALVAMLTGEQAAEGWVDGATSSIVGSTGEALQVETTALATLAWLRVPERQGNVEKAIAWLAESCQGGRYGSTQSTVLALRAIVAHDAARSRPRAAGSVRVLVDGKTVGAAVPFDEKTDGALALPDLAPFLGTGSHRIEIAMERGSEMPYAIEIKLNRLQPDSSPDCPLAITVDLSNDRLTEGEIAEATAVVTSGSGEPTPMAVAIVGLPGGLEPRHEQLKELVRAKRVAAYEVIGREVVLYFRSLGPHAVERVPLSLVAAVPGKYTGPASRAYLYYGDEQKAWAPGLAVEIAAR